MVPGVSVMELASKIRAGIVFKSVLNLTMTGSSSYLDLLDQYKYILDDQEKLFTQKHIHPRFVIHKFTDKPVHCRGNNHAKRCNLPCKLSVKYDPYKKKYQVHDVSSIPHGNRCGLRQHLFDFFL